MTKYSPCYHCGKKPKAIREDGVWFLDHECIVQTGHMYLGSEQGLNILIKCWNERQKDKRE